MTATETTTQLYIPDGCTTLDKLIDDQIRVGIQGYPFSGKTFATLSFPWPIILSIDRKTNAHQHRSDAVVVPFYDPVFIDKIKPRDGIAAPPNRKDALLIWLARDGAKIPAGHTLIVDGASGIEIAFHSWFKQNEHLALTKKGVYNDFKEWDLKNEFFEDLHTYFKALKCNVILICHETPERKEGDLTGQIKPLLTGKSGDQLAGNFTDWFRALTVTKPTPEKMQDFKKKFGLDDTRAQEWINSTPAIHNTIYIWDTQASENCRVGTSSLVDCPRYILAGYDSFRKYRKPTNQVKTTT